MLTSNSADSMIKELKNNGWKIFGYRADQSDSMTDYWCPSSWSGIASKDGYVLLIDAYGTGKSGYKVTKQTVKVDNEKIQKLEATMNDAASTDNEKAVCQKKIDEMYNKEKESTVVIEEYPTFSHATPKKCTWHIEKNGVIIAKGIGTTDKNIGWDNEKVIKLVKRFEKEIKNNSQLEAVQEEVIEKVEKFVEVDIKINELEVNKSMIQLKGDYTGGHYRGAKYILVDTYKRVSETIYTFVRLGKRNQPLKRYGAANNSLTLSEATLQKGLEKQFIVTVELKEVEEVTYKTVYKKVARKQEVKPAQEDNLLGGEVSEVTEETSQENTATKRQRFALHMASKRTIDTREIVISKEKASELIGKSKQGEDITEELKMIAGIVEEVETVEEVKEEVTVNKTVEAKEEVKEEMNINMERLADTFTDLVCEAGKRYGDMSKEEKAQLVNELTDYINNYNVSLSEEDMNYLEANYPVLHLIFSSKQETVKADTLEGKMNEKQLETLNTRLEKEHVKPLTLYKDDKTNSIVLECLNTNLENASRFCFSIDEKGIERGKGYAYPTDELQLIKVYSNEGEELEVLFHHESLTDAQNKVINRICNRWKGSDKYTFVAVHKGKDENEKAILHFKINNHKMNSFMYFNKEGHKIYSSSYLNQTFDPTELLHEFDNETREEKEVAKVDNSTASGIAYKLNEEQNGVEIYFSEKPNEEVRALLKANKFRYSSRNKCWYSKQNNKTVQLAKELSNGSINDETVTYEDINIDDCTEYTVSEELVNRENDSNWIFRREKKDHNKDLQEHFTDYTNKVKEIISTTNKESIIYNLKNSLQRYKKKYHEVYVKQLTVKANNPSWAVTGRSGRNMNRYNKEMDRSTKLMLELVELTSNIDRAIEKAKRDIKKLEKEIIKKAVSNVSVNEYNFRTVTKSTDTHQNVRMYELDGYYIAKNWGTFRIFYKGKEVYAMKTNETLKDAKQYVIYLIQKERDVVTA